MSKERLEEIRDKYSKANIIEHLYGKDIIAVDKKDMDYITEESIEQAERVQGLEELLTQIKYDKEAHIALSEKYLKKQLQNKRYREAIERALGESGWGDEGNALYRTIGILTKALEESE